MDFSAGMTSTSIPKRIVVHFCICNDRQNATDWRSGLRRDSDRQHVIFVVLFPLMSGEKSRADTLASIQPQAKEELAAFMRSSNFSIIPMKFISGEQCVGARADLNQLNLDQLMSGIAAAYEQRSDMEVASPSSPKSPRR